MARKFLYIIAILIVLAIAALFALRMFSTELSRVAFVPTTEFTPEPAMPQTPMPMSICGWRGPTLAIIRRCGRRRA